MASAPRPAPARSPRFRYGYGLRVWVLACFGVDVRSLSPAARAEMRTRFLAAESPRGR